MKATSFLLRRLVCWWSGHKWATKRNERFCYRCGARQIYTVLPGGRARGGRWIDKHEDS